MQDKYNTYTNTKHHKCFLALCVCRLPKDGTLAPKLTVLIFIMNRLIVCF